MQSEKRDKADEVVVRLWRQGASIEAIAKALGCTSAAVRGRAVRLRRAGVSLDKRGAWTPRSVDLLERGAAMGVVLCSTCGAPLPAGSAPAGPGPR